ncbi:ABC transporter substrate-binding protein, partial [Candidatus Aerophobetes bacterium]
FKKFEDYWGGWKRPYLDRIIVKIIKEAVVSQQMLEAGEVDLATRIPIDSIARVQAREDCEVLRGPSFMNYCLHLNTAKPPLDKKLVRQAISYAIPYQDIIKVSVAGWGRQAVGPVPYGEFGHDEYLYQYRYNLDKARKLMAEAGYPKGIDGKLILTYAAENIAEKKFCPLIKEGLGKIGIEVEIRPMIWTSQWEWVKGDPQKAQDLAALLWWPTFNDPYDTLYSLWHAEEEPYWNFAYYKNPKFDQLIKEAYETSGSDPERAKGLYSTAQQILIMDAPSVFLFDVERGVYKRANLKGYIINPSYPRVPFFYYMYKE